jgi:hypothetical protein
LKSHRSAKSLAHIACVNEPLIRVPWLLAPLARVYHGMFEYLFFLALTKTTPAEGYFAERYLGGKVEW